MPICLLVFDIGRSGTSVSDVPSCVTAVADLRVRTPVNVISMGVGGKGLIELAEVSGSCSVCGFDVTSVKFEIMGVKAKTGDEWSEITHESSGYELELI